jgi:hypothetical protein
MSSEAKVAMARAMTEDELLSTLVEAALLLGWRVHHARRSDKAVTMGTQGLPDLIMAKAGRVVFAEVKDAKGQLTEGQWAWLLAIEVGGGHFLEPAHHDRLGRVTALVIRPTDLDHVLRLMAAVVV